MVLLMNNKTKAQIGMKKNNDAIMFQRRIGDAALKEKKKLEAEGFDVDALSISVSVLGDNRPLWKPEKYFVKVFKSYIKKINTNYGLSTTEMGIIYTLSNYINYENNLITNSDGTPMIKKDLTLILGLGVNAIDKHIAALVKKGVLTSAKIKRSVNYYLNPMIAYQGKRIDPTLLTLFHLDSKSFK